MSGDTQTHGTVGLARVRDLLGRTGVAIRGALRRRDGRLIVLFGSIVYLALYEYGTGNLAPGSGDVDVFVVADPVGRALQPIAPFQYEPIARLSLGPVEYLFSPLTAGIGLALAVLVGVNLAVSWVVWRGPQACRVNPGVGAAAGIPALLSGFACCGPTVLLVVGLQATAGMVALFQWLVPAAFVLLLATLLWVGRHVQPDGPVSA